MSNSSTKTLTASNFEFANAIVQQLDVLSNRREKWETTEYKKANDGLYAIQAECLHVYKSRFMEASASDKKALRQELAKRLKDANVRTTSNTTTLNMLVRYVFNSDRKRAQGYASVLTAALSHDIKVEDYSQWVVDQGGIEEIKRKSVKKPEAIAKQQAVEAAKSVVVSELEINSVEPLAHVNLDGLTGNYAVLLAKPNPDGGADIVGALSNISDALVNALILRLAKQHVETAEADKELGRQVAQEHSDMLAANDDKKQLKVANF
jgi:hypothetical protein